MKQFILTLFLVLILVNSLKIPVTPVKKEFIKKLVEYSKNTFNKSCTSCVKSNDNVKVVYVDESLPFKYYQQFYENMINSAEMQSITHNKASDLEIMLICKDKSYESFVEYAPKKPFMHLKNSLLENIKIKIP